MMLDYLIHYITLNVGTECQNVILLNMEHYCINGKGVLGFCNVVLSNTPLALFDFDLFYTVHFLAIASEVGIIRLYHVVLSKGVSDWKIKNKLLLLNGMESNDHYCSDSDSHYKNLVSACFVNKTVIELF